MTASSSPAGQLERQIQVALVAGVDDGRVGCAEGVVTGADEQPGHRVDRLLGGGQPDPDRRSSTTDMVEPLQGERQMRAPLVTGERMDLVHDDRATEVSTARDCVRR